MSRLLEKLSQVSTANVSDVLESLGVLHPHITSVTPGKHMVGTAFTVRAYPGSIITVHKALLEASPGDVIVVDGEGDIQAGALFGEIMAKECAVKGFAGIVVDGAVRDVDGLLDEGLPVFARAVTPRVGTNRRLGATQVPISCGGVAILPGDLIVGDDNGVVVIPADKTETLIGALDALLEKERGLVEAIERGTYLAETLGFAALFSEE
jgi:RraA family protein